MEFGVLSKTKAKELKSLSTSKGREKLGLFLAEGEKCVKDLLSSFEVEFIVTTKDWIENHPEIAQRYLHCLQITDKRGLEIISSMKSVPDVIAVFRIPRKTKDNNLLKRDKYYVLLDEIQDPGNLGTIIRTCDWFGIYDIYASENSVDVYGPKVVQSTMGSLSRVRVHYVNLSELILKNRHIKLYGTLLSGTDYKVIQPQSGGMLLFGNEGRGISPDLQELINEGITIPPIHADSHPDSLNVAIAAAIIISRFEKNG